MGGGEGLTFEELLTRLDNVQGHGGQRSARCPAHDDHANSLSVSAGKDGRILLKCHAGCTAEEICGALGITAKDLFPAAPSPKATSKRKIVARYDYYDRNGAFLYQKTRWLDEAGKKSFTWSHKDSTGRWQSGRGDAPLILYNEWEALEHDRVFLVEGEKDVETMRTHLHLPAVSTPDGADKTTEGNARKWKPHFTEALTGKSVVIIPDNDGPGKTFAQYAASVLHGKAASVKLLDLKSEWDKLPEHGDITDVLEAVGDPQKVAFNLEALETMAEEYIPEEAPPDNEGTDKFAPRIVRAIDVPYTPPRWLIAPYFQRGKGTLIQADNGTGKTVFMCAIAAHVSTGRPILGLPIETPGDVLVLSVEDELPTLRGRIEADGGDLSRCHLIEHAAGLTLTSPEIEEFIKATNAKLLIFDPLQAFLGSDVDMFRANETRPVLAKLFDMCDRNDCACAIISHEGKNTFGKSAVNRALGSVDIPASMRSILQIIQDPSDPSLIVAVHVKCSNAPRGKSLSYRIIENGGLTWEGFSEITVEDLAAIEKRREKEKVGLPYEKEPLVQVFNQLITDRPGGGFWSYDEVKRRGAEILGFPPFSSTNDLKNKLDGGLTKELQKNDSLIVTHGVRHHGGVRGIRIEQYQVPENYQAHIDT